MSKRSKQVAGLIQQEISDIVRKLKDPRIGFVTITEVALTDDLRSAKVYFSVLGDQAQKEHSVKGFERAGTYIQNEVGTRLRLRYVPILRFCLDETLQYSEKIEKLIDKIHDQESTNRE